MLKIRHKIFDNTGNIILQWCYDFAMWNIRRNLHNNLSRYYSQLEESLGYRPTDAELQKHGEFKFDTNGTVFFIWKGRYLFEMKN